MTITESFVELTTNRGPMRVHLFAPAGDKKYPAVIFFSEIFKLPGRSVAWLRL